MIRSLDFENEGKKYTAVVEPLGAAGQDWWWFRVSGDTHRYAPFHAAKSDTKDNVRTRIVAYYLGHLAARAAPPPMRGHWARKQQAAAGAPPGTPAAAPTTTTTK